MFFRRFLLHFLGTVIILSHLHHIVKPNKKRLHKYEVLLISNGEPGGIRTHDTLIKSQVLYQLSYRFIY